MVLCLFSLPLPTRPANLCGYESMIRQEKGTLAIVEEDWAGLRALMLLRLHPEYMKEHRRERKNFKRAKEENVIFFFEGEKKKLKGGRSVWFAITLVTATHISGRQRLVTDLRQRLLGLPGNNGRGRGREACLGGD